MQMIDEVEEDKMNVYKISLIQKSLVIGMLAVTCGVMVMSALADRKTELQMSAMQKVIVTREVELKPFTISANSENNIAHANLKVSNAKNPSKI